MRLDYHKLVRDGIPRIIEAGCGRPVTRVPDRAGYLVALRTKLVEEAEETQADGLFGLLVACRAAAGRGELAEQPQQQQRLVRGT
jgi:hypothetical protein